MKKILTLLCVFATLPIGAIELTPGAFRALQGVGLGFDGMRLITSLSQWGAEAAVVRLQKQVARLEAALEKRKDSLTPRALERATRQIARAKKRLASRIKGLSANHRITMGLTAASEAAHVRNNWSEKGLGVLGAGLATAQLPPTRIGKHAWLKSLLGAADAGLGIARGLYYKNPRQMALFTAAQRATRLLHLLATYGLPGKNKRMIATYIAQALSLVAASMGDPRESKGHFDWAGKYIPPARGSVGIEQDILRAEINHPLVSRDRRQAMRMTGRTALFTKDEIQEMYERGSTFQLNQLLVDDALKEQVKEWLRSANHSASDIDVTHVIELLIHEGGKIASIRRQKRREARERSEQPVAEAIDASSLSPKKQAVLDAEDDCGICDTNTIAVNEKTVVLSCGCENNLLCLDCANRINKCPFCMKPSITYQIIKPKGIGIAHGSSFPQWLVDQTIFSSKKVPSAQTVTTYGGEPLHVDQEYRLFLEEMLGRSSHGMSEDQLRGEVIQQLIRTLPRESGRS